MSKIIYPVFKQGHTYAHFALLENELWDIVKDKEDEKVDIEIYLDKLKKHQIKSYIMHVLRPFLAKVNHKVTIKVAQETIRKKWIELAEKALGENYLRYSQERYLVITKYTLKRQTLPRKHE